MQLNTPLAAKPRLRCRGCLHICMLHIAGISLLLTYTAPNPLAVIRRAGLGKNYRGISLGL